MKNYSRIAGTVLLALLTATALAQCTTAPNPATVEAVQDSPDCLTFEAFALTQGGYLLEFDLTATRDSIIYTSEVAGQVSRRIAKPRTPNFVAQMVFIYNEAVRQAQK